MAKPKRKSQTYIVNRVGEVVSCLALGVITYADELKGVIPEQAYIGLLIASFTYNRWRRTRTNEPIE